MQNIYFSSDKQTKKACSISDDDGDDYENVSDISKNPAVPTREKKIDPKACSLTDDEDEDYENASDLSKTPAVPTREKKIDTTAKKEELQLKYLPKPVNINLTQDPIKVTLGLPKPVNVIHSQDHLNVASGARPGPSFQPPHIGLDFSSSAVNAAFRDVLDEPNGKNKKGSGWMKLSLVMCLILIFLMVILIFSIMFVYYSNISNELSDIKLNVSEIQETAQIDRDLRVEGMRRLNQTFEEKIDSLKSKILNNERSVEEKIDSLKSEILFIKRAVGICTICPTDWNLLDYTCYYFSKAHKTWEDSSKDCIKQGSELLILHNRKELDLVKTRTGNKRYWIGLKKVNGVWKWVDKTSTTFTNWNAGEPNNYGAEEHCTEMIAGGWNDLSCSNTIDYICERPPDCRDTSTIV